MRRKNWQSRGSEFRWFSSWLLFLVFFLSCARVCFSDSGGVDVVGALGIMPLKSPSRLFHPWCRAFLVSCSRVFGAPLLSCSRVPEWECLEVLDPSRLPCMSRTSGSVLFLGEFCVAVCLAFSQQFCVAVQHASERLSFLW